MIWLASFPRSGNTFFRNVLHDVYGIESSVFTPLSKTKANKSDRVIKTHMLPTELVPFDTSISAVYLVRDGRDAAVSMAYHKSNITAPGTDFLTNLKSIISPVGNEHFGGWSRNVEAWLNRASVLIKFEDLIINPISELEKIRSIINLPEPDVEKLPTFESQKGGKAHYSRRKKEDKLSHSEIDKLFFRKGEVGGWKEEMSDDIHQMFWDKHGKTMEKLGYTFSGEIENKNIDNLLTHSSINSIPFITKASKNSIIFNLKKWYKK